MSEQKIAGLLKPAIVTVVGDVSYSNPLPDWYSTEGVDYVACVRRLRQRVASYLKGGKPLKTLRVQVPTRTGQFRTWVIPAVNDQIIFQACVSTLSQAISKGFDRKRVFSCEPDLEPSSKALMKNQIAAWVAFQNETLSRIRVHRYVLELDIRNAFASIDRGQFVSFLAGLQGNGPAIELVRLLLNSWSGGDPGLPRTNDSMFFLGSAYLNRVDSVVARYSNNFIRYMDDYRIFGDSQRALEQTFEKVSTGLAAIGFRLNPMKVNLASQKDYLEAVSQPKFESKDQSTVEPGRRRLPQYIQQVDTGISSQLVPPQIEKLVVQTLRKPAEYLNEGVGRHLIGSLRRFRLNAAIRHRFNPEDVASAPGVILRRLLGSNPDIQRLTNGLLSEYSSKPEQAWRLIWLIYLVEQAGTAQQMKGHLTRLESSKQMPPEVRLWARRCLEGRGGEPLELREEMHDLSYLEAGERCYGGKPCKDVDS